MPFTPGHKQSNGRPKGAENKEKKTLRESISSILEAGIEDFNSSMAELRETNPKAYLDVYIKLIEYGLPKMRSVDTTISAKDNVESIKIEIKSPPKLDLDK
jgi:hypothetical protein